MKSTKRRLVSVGSILAAFVMIGFLAQPAFAIKPFLEQMRKAYTLNNDVAKCNLCHAITGQEKAGRKNVNDYAKELSQSASFGKLGKIDGRKALTPEDIKNLQAAIKEIGTKDSDGDGATNDEELKLGTAPGDSAKKPAANTLEQYRKAQPAKPAK